MNNGPGLAGSGRAWWRTQPSPWPYSWLHTGGEPAVALSEHDLAQACFQASEAWSERTLQPTPAAALRALQRSLLAQRFCSPFNQ